MDILKYGPEVEVVSPPELRKEISCRHEAAAVKYRQTKQN
jgi:predicted DNA-binding transcriptional regulator YafY